MTVGFSDKSVVSMGGLKVGVDKTIARVGLDEILVFFIPGGPENVGHGS